MKANEAPEKIYLYPDDRAGYEYEAEWGDKPWGEDYVEYTRTDAFIEKAVKFMCNCIEEEMARHLETWHPDMKAKTIERFKNYMKGE